MHKKLIRLITLILFATQNIYSQTDSISKKQVDVMDVDDIIQGKTSSDQKIVSASRSSKSVDELPFTVYLVTEEDIRRNGYTTLVDVLKNVPGIRVSQPGSAQEGETFLMRGLQGNYYAKILINNIPISPSVVSGMPIGEQLPIRQAERIEIIYGPSSAVYGGGDAMVGIINIITKTPENSTYAQADVILGQYGYQHLNFMVSGKAGKNKNVLQYNVFGSQGERTNVNIQHYTDKDIFNTSNYLRFARGANPSVPTPSVTLAELKTDYPYYGGTLEKATIGDIAQKSRMIGIDLNFRGLRFTYLYMYRRDFSSLGLSPLTFSYDRPENYIGEAIERYSLSYVKAFDKLTLTTNLSYLKYRMDKNSSFGFNYEDGNNGRAYTYAASDDIFFEQLINYNLTKNWELTGGFSFQYSGNLPLINFQSTAFNPSDYQSFSTVNSFTNQPVSGFGYYPFNYSYIGAFLQGYYTKNRFSAIINYRVDIPSNYASTSSLRLAFLYKTGTKSSLRLSIGTSYRIPSGYYRFNSYAANDMVMGQQKVSYQLLPNSELKPEQASSVELGFRYKISPKVDLDINLYVTILNQSISRSIIALDTLMYPNSSDTQGVGSFVRSYTNAGDTYSNLIGLQANLRARDIIPSIKLNADLFVTISEGEEKLPNDNGIIPAVRQVPELQIQCNIGLSPFKNFNLNIKQVFCTSWYRRFIPNAQVFDLKEFTQTEGYYVLDFVGSYHIGKNLAAFLNIRNALDTQYGGIDATGLDQDLVYNPQLGRNFQLGLSFRLK